MTREQIAKSLKLDKLLRRLNWLFSRSGIIPLAFEHFLAMIPATILVPVHINNEFGATVIDMSLVLFTSGIGTLLFILLSKGTIPVYLGSSFAYIGLTKYLLQEQMNMGADRTMAFTYVGWAYIFSGIVLVLLSLLYRIKGVERAFRFLLPATVIGPAISLIGLELADTAVVDSGFNKATGEVDANAVIVSILTLSVIVLFSLFKHKKMMKNAAIIVGVLVGSIVYFSMNGFPTEAFSNLKWFTLPNFNFVVLSLPPNPLGLFIAILPPTFIVFTENIGRYTVVSRIIKDNEKKEKVVNTLGNGEIIEDDTGDNDIFTEHSMSGMRKSILLHGISVIAASVIGSVPNTIYAENIAVMSIHKTEYPDKDPDKFVNRLLHPTSCIPYIIAAFFAIFFSFLDVLQVALREMPKPVIGGMELFLFGIISAPGIQLLVDQRVNYKKFSNQIVTAAVLITGISELVIDIGFFQLKGMSLGFVVGIMLNIIVQVFKWLGYVSDTVTYDEMVEEVLSTFSNETKFRILGYQRDSAKEVDENRNCSILGFAYALKGKDCRVRMPDGSFMSDDIIRDEVQHTTLLEVGQGKGESKNVVVRFRKTENGLFTEFKSSEIDDKIKKEYLHDYEDYVDENDGWLLINIAGVPTRKIRTLVRLIDRQ